MTDLARQPRRRFVDVHGRQVHYLRLGEGPPALLVHSSPLDAWYVLPQMQALASHPTSPFTCFAFDSPGFGLSQALPGDPLQVADLAQALADNMGAIGLPPCPVFGTHTGAAIALSLGAHHPERVTALVLDGVPIFTPQEFEQLFDGYFEALVPDARGGHFANTWTRFRDQYAWFPWTSKDPARHNPIDLGDAAALQAWVLSFFHAGRSYKPAYRAAIQYGQQAVEDSRALRCPAVFTATPTDMLLPHLARLPALKADQQIRPLGKDKQAKEQLISEVFEAWPAQATAPPDGFRLAPGPQMQQQFVDLPWGQMLWRFAGVALQAEPVLLLHDAPGTARQHEDLMRVLATRHRVLAPDLPGCGGSAPLPSAQDEPALAAWADALAAACALMGVSTVCAYGIGIGASLALALAERHPGLVRGVVLRGLALPDAAERAELLQRYAPEITLQADGSHWYRTWLMLRDREIWFPWYDTRAARLRRVPGDFDAYTLHQRTFEVMKQHANHSQVLRAALAHDAAASLSALRQPIVLCADPQVPFFAYHERLRQHCPEAALLPSTAEGHADALAAWLAAGAHRSALR